MEKKKFRYFFFFIFCLRNTFLFSYLPFNAMSGCEYVSVIDQHSTAIEPIKVTQASHPRELIHSRCLTAHNSTLVVSFAASLKRRRKKKEFVLKLQSAAHLSRKWSVIIETVYPRIYSLHLHLLAGVSCNGARLLPNENILFV